MCHLILLLPVLSLPILWLMPLSIAGPLYSLVLFLSGLMYYLTIQVMRRPVNTGAEEILQSKGQVIERHEGAYLVRVHSEIWIARSSDSLRPNDWIRVVGRDGLKLKVERISKREWFNESRTVDSRPQRKAADGT